SLNDTTPFMAQKKVEKRKFIEGILSLSIFSEMLQQVRADYNETKKKLEIESVKKNEVENNLKIYTEQSKNFETRKKSEIEKIEERRQIIQERINELKKKVESFQQDTDVKQLRDKLRQLKEKNNL